MTDVEDQLRRDLVTITERAQPGSIRPLRAPQPSRRRRTIRWLAPVTAMAAVIGIIAGVSLAGQSAGNRPPSTALPPGTPKYYVTLTAVIPGGVTATVRQSATGAAVGSVLILRLPGKTFPGNPLSISAAANDRVFAIGYPFRLDILRLAPDGRIERLTHLPHTIDGYQFAQLSPDGSELALPIPPSTASCTKTSPCTAGVTVVSLATGATRTWRARTPVEMGLYTVNWLGTGHEVSFVYGGNRLLNVAGPGGSLLANSRPIASPAGQRGWVMQSWLVTPDANAVIAGSVRQTHGKYGVTAGRVAEFSARTGRLIRVLYTVTEPTASAGRYPTCTLESAGPTGLHFLIQCIRLGRLDGNHFTALPGLPAHPFLGVQAAW
ncbi:MAG: hypothetical protein ACLQFR_13185 [Streptosporangiaceae bacterium]